MAQLIFQSLVNPSNYNYRLLLFLIDGLTNDWNISCANDITSEWQPRLLIKLKQIEPISRIELSFWLEKYLDYRNLLQLTETQVQEILERSDDEILEYVIKDICNRCNITLEAQESKWLKY